MEINEFNEYFKENLNINKINIKDEDLKKYFNFMNLLLEWNKIMNLTSITDEKQIIKKHFIDSLTILKYINDKDKIIDIGTGAGFPGIPIAISKDINITLLDSLNKRIKFLNEIKEKVELNNVELIHGRSEDLGQNNKYREKYDVVVSRAVAAMNILVEYLLPFAKIGGKCICMKGPNVEDEVNKSKKAIEKLGGKIELIETINLGEDEGMRNIIVIKKIKETPQKYPRKAGIPRKMPL